jgi:hypothetical protein
VFTTLTASRRIVIAGEKDGPATALRRSCAAAHGCHPAKASRRLVSDDRLEGREDQRGLTRFVPLGWVERSDNTVGRGQYDQVTGGDA